MLDSKKNYVGREVEVFNTGLKGIDGKKFKIIGQFPNERQGLIFDLNVRNPNSKKVESLSIKESQCKVL